MVCTTRVRLTTRRATGRNYKYGTVKVRNISALWRCGKMVSIANQWFLHSKQCRKHSKSCHIERMCHHQQLSSHPPTKATLKASTTLAEFIVLTKIKQMKRAFTHSKLGLFAISTFCGRHSDPINVTPEINSIPIQIELHTEASCP